MGIQFHETVMGHRFFEGQLPALIKGINRLADIQEENAKLAAAQVAGLSKVQNRNQQATAPTIAAEKENKGFTPAISETTKIRLLQVLKAPQKADAFGFALREEISSDDEKDSRTGFYVAKAILDGNMDDLLMAICGWRVSTLLDKADAVYADAVNEGAVD